MRGARNAFSTAVGLIILSQLGCGSYGGAAGPNGLSTEIDTAKVQRIYADEIHALAALVPELPQVFSDSDDEEAWATSKRESLEARNFIDVEVACTIGGEARRIPLVDKKPALRIHMYDYPARAKLEHLQITKVILHMGDGQLATHRLSVRQDNCSATALLKPVGYELPEEPPLIDSFYPAIQRGDIAEAKAIIEQLDDVNTRDVSGATPLHHAAFFGPTEVVELLLERGADINLSSRTGGNLLHECVLGKQAEIAEFALRAGADVDSTDNCGATPLHQAAGSNDLEMVKVLVRHGADVNRVMQGCAGLGAGDTPLHEAANAGTAEIGAFLIQRGANLEARNRFARWTPLHIAAMRGNEGMVRVLLEAGADPNARDVRGETPIHLVGRTAANPDKLRQMLRDHGAEP